MAIKVRRKRITKPPEERRQDIMDAAVRVFADKGVARTTVSDITEAAGVAKGTFYLYFPSKEVLLGALKERFVNESLERAAELFERVGRDDWWALVDIVVENSIDFHLQNRDIIHVLVQEGITPDTSDIFRQCEQKLIAMFVEGIQAGVNAGAFRVTDPELVGAFLFHAMDGAMNHAILYEKDIDRDRLVAGGKELTRKILSP